MCKKKNKHNIWSLKCLIIKFYKKKTTKMMGIGYESKSFISFSLHNSMYH